jgi:hypothetical protein
VAGLLVDAAGSLLEAGAASCAISRSGAAENINAAKPNSKKREMRLE